MHMKDFRKDLRREFKDKAKEEVGGSAVEGKLDKMAGNARDVPGGDVHVRDEQRKKTPQDR
jgi:hypothetical protein